MSQPAECPRCHLPASETARRRGRCTACGASLASAHVKASDVRELLQGRRAPAPLDVSGAHQRSASR